VQQLNLALTHTLAETQTHTQTDIQESYVVVVMAIAQELTNFGTPIPSPSFSMTEDPFPC